MTLRTPSETRIAVVGAGMAGLACAAQLRENGLCPTVFEKSRGIGGRLATRRMGSVIAFDHGAQYLTARTTGFRNFIGRAIDSGSADRWEPKTHNPSLGAADGWFVGTPGMSALVKPLADELDIRFLTEVTEIHREKDAWRVRTSRDNSGDLFDLVVCCAPAPQTRALVASTQEMASALAKVSMAPCWALMLSLVTAIDPGFEVWRSKSDNLAWISRNSSKPQRPAELDNWVAHASPDWSRRHLELDRGQVAELMLEMLTRRFGGQLPEIEHLSAHRWRYAMTTAPLGKPYICSEDRTLFVGGDWCLGARVESAHESGQLIANAIMDAL